MNATIKIVVHCDDNNTLTVTSPTSGGCVTITDAPAGDHATEERDELFLTSAEARALSKALSAIIGFWDNKELN